MRLCELLDGATVKIDMAAGEKEEAIEELVDALVRAGRIPDRQAAINAVLSREQEQTTGIGGGIAVPHAKEASITKLTAALGISKAGIEFDAVDDKPVNVVFLILARVDDPGPHIRALAEIARLLQIPGFFRKIVDCQSTQELLSVISAEE